MPFFSFKNRNKIVPPIVNTPIPINDTDTYKLVVTRHGFSCNNATDTSGFLKKWYRTLIKGQKVLDPHLTDYGIEKTFQLSSINKDKYKSNIVFVSCLLRTWETATLLYLPHLTGNRELNIVIAPFLKEKHLVYFGGVAHIKNGNYPPTSGSGEMEEMDINVSIKKFLQFLSLLERKKDILKIDDTPIFTKNKLSKISIHYNGKKYLLNEVFIQKNIFKYNGGDPDNMNNQYIQIPSKNDELSTNDQLPDNSNESVKDDLTEEQGPDTALTIHFSKNETQPLVVKTGCEPQLNYLYPNTSFNYYVSNNVANILLFIQWCGRNIGNNISFKTDGIHVVAHSNIMQSFIKVMKNMYRIPDLNNIPLLGCNDFLTPLPISRNNNVNGFDRKTNEVDYRSITKSNSWSIDCEINYSPDGFNLFIEKITNGVPKIKNVHPEMYELCLHDIRPSTTDINLRAINDLDMKKVNSISHNIFTTINTSGGKTRKNRRTRKHKNANKKKTMKW
jgi:hypothetical protein